MAEDKKEVLPLVEETSDIINLKYILRRFI